MSTSDERGYRGAFFAPKKSKFRCTRLAGVEWEYNHRNDEVLEWAESWNAGVHYDGSCGYEAVTPPIAGDNIDKCLRELGQAITDSGTPVRDSCGVHVHVDAKDLSWPDMIRLLRVYAHVEPILYLLAGQERATNQYCRPMGPSIKKALEHEDKKGAIMAMIYEERVYDGDDKIAKAKEVQRQRPGKKDGGRYRGLNIVPWLTGRTGRRPKKDATVEFRMHRNARDSERIIGWTKLCVRLVDWCSKATDKEVDALPKSALRALALIAPDCLPWILKRVKEWRRATQVKMEVPRRIKLTKTGYELKVSREAA